MWTHLFSFHFPGHAHPATRSAFRLPMSVEALEEKGLRGPALPSSLRLHFQGPGDGFHTPAGLALTLSLTELLLVLGPLTGSAHGMSPMLRVNGGREEAGLSSSASTCSRVPSDFTSKHKGKDKN